MTQASRSFHVAPLSADHTKEIATWRYRVPFDRYDPGPDAASLLDPSNHAIAIIDSTGVLVGFRTFGPDGQVPGFSYDDHALDTGGGLAPHRVDTGIGASVIDLGLRHGEAKLHLARWRVTVWEENQRALVVLGRLGFSPIGRFVGPNQTGYQVLTMGARQPDAQRAH